MSELCEHKGGRGAIPPRLYITVIVMFIAAIAFLIVVAKKGFLRYELVTPEMMQESYVTSTLGHGLYRMFVAIWSFGIIMYAIHLGKEGHRVGWDLRYFTVWNYTTFCLLFILLSAQHVFTYVPRWLTKVTWTLFQVELTNAIFLDIVFWGVLFPQANREEVLAMPVFFITVNVHAINSVFLLGEVLLGTIEMVPGQIAWVAIYSLTYIAFTWINYSESTDCMPYPFLAATPKDAPGIYVGMCVVISIIYALVYGLVRLRDRYFTGSGVANTGYAPIA